MRLATADARFFAATPPLPVAALNRVPIEALLLQIENHVRLEHAAAECFLASPNPALLHSQFETLEPPGDALQVNIDATPEEIAGRIRRGLGL